jgi:putative transposase
VSDLDPVGSRIIDTSTKFKNPTIEEMDMKHISIRKTRYVVRLYREGQASNRRIWKEAGISKSSFYRILERYSDLWPAYKLDYIHKVYRKPGKTTAPISEDVIAAAIKARQTYKVGAVRLERILRSRGINLSHNIINSILREEDMIKLVPKRGGRKKYVRWERRYSLSLWQTDWSILGKQWLIVFIDDASRLIVGWGLFDHATSENSVKVLKKAIETYGKPKAILSGRDVQFYSADKKGMSSGKNYFQKFLDANNIDHILARVNHPQTCGKVERFFGEVKNRLRWGDFDNVGDIVRWHNEIKPHGSLREDILETPMQAFVRKMHPKKTTIKMVAEV